MSVSLVPIAARDSFVAPAATNTNLLQSWEWGEAKAQAEGWRVKRFALARGEETLALVQVLEKARLWRINRGPLWARPDLTEDDKAQCLGAVQGAARWWKGRLLLIAPELPEIPAAITMRRRSAPRWSSAWVDLATKNEDSLRKSLNGKWRNMLVNAEKAGMTVTVSTDLDTLLPRYLAMMAEKGFQGVSPALLEELARQNCLLTLTARANDEPVSIVLLARHFQDATYLVGWNSDEGRVLRANHLLLWRALLELKGQGCRGLDLGGIDDALTPGVAAFKRGLGGREYTLAGEFLSL